MIISNYPTYYNDDGYSDTNSLMFTEIWILGFHIENYLNLFADILTQTITTEYL